MKTTRKFMAILMVLAMVLSMGVLGAFAAETSNLKINTVNGHTYTVYQLLTGDVSNLSAGSGTLSNTKVGANVVAGKTVDDVKTAINGKSNGALGDAAYALINTSSTPAEIVAGDGSAKTVTVDDGYYVVVDSWTNGAIEGQSLSRYLVAVVGDTEMSPKANTVDIDKEIVDTDANKPLDDDKKTNTAAIGDTVNFKITSTVPSTEGYKYYYFVAHDTMSKGLDLDEASIVVKVGVDTLVEDEDYYVYVTNNDNGTTTIEIAFENMKKLVDDGNIVVGEQILITYDAVINDNAEIGGKIPNTNEVYPIYSNNPSTSDRNDVEDKPGVPQPGTATGVGPTKTTKTYVTELTLLKVNQDGAALAGAEFTLTGVNLTKVIVNTEVSFDPVEAGTGDYYLLKDGTYTKTAPSTVAEGEEGYNADLYASLTPDYVLKTSVYTSTEATDDKITATTTADGYIVFTGLNVGTYTLTETKVPEGYNDFGSITFSISADLNDDGSVTWASTNTAIQLDAANGVFDTTIVNVPGTNLPTTGGMGTVIFIAVGSLFAVAAVCFLVTKKRMQNRGMN